jgi:hypothetical protein
MLFNQSIKEGDEHDVSRHHVNTYLLSCVDVMVIELPHGTPYVGGDIEDFGWFLSVVILLSIFIDNDF